MISKSTSIIIQVVIWFALFLFLLFMGTEFNSIQVSIIKAVSNVLLLIVLASLNSKILVPKFFTSKLIVLYFISAIALVISYVFVSKKIIFTDTSEIIVTIQRIGSDKVKTTNAWVFLKLVPIILSVSVLFASTILTLIKEIYKQNRLKMQIELEKKAAELKLLKTNFSPHFFLNSLNNLYSISKLKPEKTSSFIEKLTALMQYITYDQMLEKVTLKKEITFIQNYCYFQQEKGDDLYELVTDFDNVDGNLHIEPRLLIPFVENAFKFAYNPEKKMNINIQLRTANNELYFLVKNDISDFQRRSNEDGYFGVGIDSVKKLLENLYPEKHELNIINKDKKYIVELVLNLKNE